MQTVDRSKLFTASCLALLVTSLSFGIRAGLLVRWGEEFQLSTQEIANIAATAFWSFPLAIIIGGMLVDSLGMKKLLVIAFSVTFFNRIPIHWLVNNSVIAVPNMQISIKINRGFSRDLYISEVETPEDTLSVSGNLSLAKRYP